WSFNGKRAGVAAELQLVTVAKRGREGRRRIWRDMHGVRKPQRRVTAELSRDAREKAGPVVRRRRRPAQFSQRRGARKRGVSDIVLLADMFGPDIRLDSDDVAALIRRERRRSGIEIIDIAQRNDGATARRFVPPFCLAVVEIQSRSRRQNRVMTGLGRRN